MVRISQIVNGLIICFMFLFGIFVVGYSTTHYSRNAVVLNTTERQTLAIDTSGNLWNFTGDNFKDGQEVVLTIHTNGTNNIIIDDKVINAKVKRQ